jgi:hypothetical protein
MRQVRSTIRALRKPGNVGLIASDLMPTDVRVRRAQYLKGGRDGSSIYEVYYGGFR